MATDTGTSSTKSISYVARRRMQRSTMGMRLSFQFSEVELRRTSMGSIFSSTPSINPIA